MDFSLLNNKTYLIAALVVITFWGNACTDRPSMVESPDGKIRVAVEVKDSRPVYRVWYNGRQVLKPSELGLVRNDVDFSGRMALKKVSDSKTLRQNYRMKFGKQKQRRYHANQKIYYLEHDSGKPMELIFRVSNDGFAFRYRFPESSDTKFTIKEERSSFNFPEQAQAWLQPLARVNTGFAGTNPSYEEYYHQGIDVGMESPTGAGWAYPSLFKVKDTWLLISEAGMNGSYAGTRLKTQSPDGNYKVGFPMEGEVFPGGVLKPESRLPWATPWRIVAMGELETIVESTLATDLAEPDALEDTSWIEPGVASWSWAKLKDESVNYETQKRFIDYAARMGWKYTLVDVAWDSNIGYERMEELADYADSKGVGLFLWYNSSGSWNQTDYTPKSKLLTHEDRVEEFKRLEKMGIRGIKVDFFGGDGQSMMQYYRDIFRDAADYELMVNTHGSTIPRGWHRTWPNLMTMESVRGFEYITFEQANADSAATHGAMLPFTRNVFGPMDFTPMSLTGLNAVERKTTSAYELATPILFTSGVQHIAETAKGMSEVPEYVRDFVRKIPADWDQAEFVEGFPGKEVVIARRKGERWFVAGINGEKASKSLSLDLSFIPDGASGVLISGGDTKYSFNHRQVALDGQKSIDISMKGNGGFAVILE